MSLTERKRQLVRDELTDAALKLLAVQGFEQTTIEQMAAAAGVSRRTFFRYFQSKEDVIVAFLGDIGRLLRDALAARPADELPAPAVQNSLRVLAAKFADHPEKSQQLTRIIVCTPTILARYLERQAEWRANLAPELADRMGATSGDLRPALTVALTFAAFDTALTRWADDDNDDDLDTLLNTCFALLP